MIHYADLPSKTSTGPSYVLYCDAFDPLIDEGKPSLPSQGIRKGPTDVVQSRSDGILVV